MDVVVNSPDHSTLETAVIEAELADDLSGAGPFTIFAPTDDAFAALPPNLLNALLADPTGDLADILLYHVLGAEVLSTDLSDGQVATTLQGEDITVTIDGNGDVFINQAMVTAPDIRTDNGVVHVIDAVILPPSYVSTENLPAADYNITISPNPTSDYLFIELPEAPRSQIQVTVFDTNGKALMQRNLQGIRSELNTSGLNNGTYFLRFATDKANYYPKIMIAR